MGQRIFVMVTLSLALLGCARDVANRYYGEQHYSPKPVEQVELLRNKPDRPFIVIADFQSRGESPEDLRRKAAAIGADAVIVSGLGGWYSTGDEWASQDRHSDSYGHIIGTAIKFTK